MKINTKVLPIGGAKGIIIPEELLKKLECDIDSMVSIEVIENTITLRPSSRTGWEDAAMLCHNNGDDKLIIKEFFEDEEF